MIANSKTALAHKKAKKCANIMAKAVAAFEEGEAQAASGGGNAVKKGGGKGGAKACAAKVGPLEDHLKPIPEQHVRRANIESFIYQAKKFAAEGKKKKCENMVKKAEGMLTNAGY